MVRPVVTLSCRSFSSVPSTHLVARIVLRERLPASDLQCLFPLQVPSLFRYTFWLTIINCTRITFMFILCPSPSLSSDLFLGPDDTFCLVSNFQASCLMFLARTFSPRWRNWGDAGCSGERPLRGFLGCLSSSSHAAQPPGSPASPAPHLPTAAAVFWCCQGLSSAFTAWDPEGYVEVPANAGSQQGTWSDGIGGRFQPFLPLPSL